MILPVDNLLPVNLGKLGLPMKGNPDLITLWQTPYPIITLYKKVCQEFGVKPFGGGTMESQGPYSILRANSAYRDFIYNAKIGGADNSAHMYGLALDLNIGKVAFMIKAVEIAAKYFNRVIMYHNGLFIHVDLTNTLWNIRYSNGKRFALVDSNGVMRWYEEVHQITSLYEDLYLNDY